MADMYGSHFEYGGISSRKYGLIIACAETERLTQLNGQISEESIFNKSNKRKYLVGDNYADSPVSFDIEFVTDDDHVLEYKDRREIEKWLFNRHDYRRLYLDVEDDTEGETTEIIYGEQKRLYLNCRLMNPVKLEYNGGIVGYRATLEADAGFWWQDEIDVSFTLNHASAQSYSVIKLDVDTDIDDYLYPKLTIVTGNSGGAVTLKNSTDDVNRSTSFSGLPPNTTLIINGELNYVTQAYYNNFAFMNFPRLRDGENNLLITGDVASIRFQYCNRRLL